MNNGAGKELEKWRISVGERKRGPSCEPGQATKGLREVRKSQFTLYEPAQTIQASGGEASQFPLPVSWWKLSWV